MKWWKRKSEPAVCRKTHVRNDKLGISREKIWSVNTGYGEQVLMSGDTLELDLTSQLEASTQWRVTALPDGTLMIIPNKFEGIDGA